MTITFILNSETMGQGNDKVGKKLIGNFLRKLWASNTKPTTIIFYNSAVKLLAEGSPCLDAIDAVSNAGVDLVACGTCVGVYDLEDKLKYGRVSDMQSIVNIMMTSDKVITI
jgi:selenium metabolism protein YedF